MVTLGGITSRKKGLTLIGRNVSSIAREFLLGIIPVVGHHLSRVKTEASEERLRAKDIFNRIMLSLLKFIRDLVKSLLLDLSQDWWHVATHT